AISTPSSASSLGPLPPCCPLFPYSTLFRSEVLAVMAATYHMPRIAGLDVVAVDEVEAPHVRNAVPERMVFRVPDLVPAHVRHLEALAIFLQILAEEAYLAREQADAVNAVVLFAALQQRLHADADAKERAVDADFAHQFVEAQAANLGHAVADRAHARKYHAIGFTDDLCIAGHQHLAGPNMLQRLGNRMQVAHAVIDNGNGLHYRQPLVDGIWPAMRSSTASAIRRARPKALNTVSIWWWVLVPRRVSMCRVT